MSVQTRECTDLNECNPPTDIPLEIQPCEYVPPAPKRMNYHSVGVNGSDSDGENETEEETPPDEDFPPPFAEETIEEFNSGIWKLGWPWFILLAILLAIYGMRRMRRALS